MSSLKLTLKKKWYDLIKSGVKYHEYREITPYWLKRLFLFDADGNGRRLVPVDDDFCKEFLLQDDGIRTVKKMIEDKLLVPKHVEVTFYNGYAKDRPAFKAKIHYININQGVTVLGAEPGKEYFVISIRYPHATNEKLISGYDLQETIEQVNRFITPPESLKEAFWKITTGNTWYEKQNSICKINEETARQCAKAWTDVQRLREENKEAIPDFILGAIAGYMIPAMKAFGLHDEKQP